MALLTQDWWLYTIAGVSLFLFIVVFGIIIHLYVKIASLSKQLVDDDDRSDNAPQTAWEEPRQPEYGELANRYQSSVNDNEDKISKLLNAPYSIPKPNLSRNWETGSNASYSQQPQRILGGRNADIGFRNLASNQNSGGFDGKGFRMPMPNNGPQRQREPQGGYY